MEASSVASEWITAVSRLVAVLIGTIGVFVWAESLATVDVTALKIGTLLYLFGALCLVYATHRAPRPVHGRNVVSLLLDVTAVSVGLYLGAGFLDATALFYVWIMLGSGLIYGTFYLWLSAFTGAAMFGVVWLLSPYWQAQTHLSLLIAGLLLLIGPYMTLLTNTLHRARRKVRWQADHDVLTGLLNRRAFGELLENAFETRANAEHSLLYLDLDRFKLVNDSAGHAAGDEVLKHVAKLFAAFIDREHVAARHGGDEFACFLPSTSHTEAGRYAEQLRLAVSAYELVWGDGVFRVGVSAGVAPASAASSAEGWLRLADAACYAAKNNGRDRVHALDGSRDTADTQAIRKLVLPPSQSLASTGVVGAPKPKARTPQAR